MDWQDVWRRGISKQLPLDGLRNLANAIEFGDDNRLIQGKTTDPPCFPYTQEWPCDCACPIAYTYFSTHEDATVGEVEHFFHRVITQTDLDTGVDDSVRPFIDWVDSVGREDLKRDLLPLIRESIKQKESEYVGV